MPWLLAPWTSASMVSQFVDGYDAGLVASKPDGTEPERGLGAMLRQLRTVWIVLTCSAWSSLRAAVCTTGFAFWRSRSSWNIDSWERFADADPVSATSPATSETSASQNRTDGREEREDIDRFLSG